MVVVWHVPTQVGFPYIPFHFDVFRAIRRASEKLTGRTFGYRIHCGETVPFPLDDACGMAADTTTQLERARKLHVRIEEECVQRMMQPMYNDGGSLWLSCPFLARGY